MTAWLAALRKLFGLPAPDEPPAGSEARDAAREEGHVKRHAFLGRLNDVSLMTSAANRVRLQMLRATMEREEEPNEVGRPGHSRPEHPADGGDAA